MRASAFTIELLFNTRSSDRTSGFHFPFSRHRHQLSSKEKSWATPRGNLIIRNMFPLRGVARRRYTGKVQVTLSFFSTFYISLNHQYRRALSHIQLVPNFGPLEYSATFITCWNQQVREVCEGLQVARPPSFS